MSFPMMAAATFRRVLPAFALILLCFGGASPAAADEKPDAVTFINSFGQQAIRELTQPNLSDDELFKRFRTLFEQGFDVSYIAKSALGRFWRRTSESERSAYVAAFEDYMVKIYAMKFKAYSGESFTANTSQPAPEGGVTVSSTVVKPDGPQTKIDWIVDDESGSPKIRDIKIEGVSMVNSYRDEFANEILQHDGKVAGLIDALRDKTAHLGSEDSG